VNKHITAEQLQELTEDQKERLRAWWKPEEGDKFYGKDWRGRYCTEWCVYVNEEGEVYRYGYGDIDKMEDCLPLLSIGQMIELLAEEDPGSWSINCTTSGGWYITSNNLYGPKFYVTNNDGTDFIELCDALWQAVKEAL